MSRFLLAAAIGLGLFAEIAHADADVASADPPISYDIGPALPCLTPVELEARVAPMLGAGADASAREERARVLVEGVPTRVTVRVVRDGVEQGAREIARSDGRCDDELVGTVAVVVATLLAPPAPPTVDATVPAPTRTRSEPTTAALSDDVVEHEDVEHEDVEHEDVEHEDVEHEDVEHEDVEHEPAAAPEDSVWVGASASLVLAIGMIDIPSFGLDAHVDVGARGGMSGRLGITILPFARIDGAPGAELSYGAVDARVCSPTFVELRPLRLLVCAGPSVGMMRGLGTNVAVAHERFEVVVDVAASLVGALAITDEVAIGLEIGGRALLVRPRFYVESEPERIILHTPNEVVPWVALTLVVGDPRPPPTATPAPPPPSL